MPTKSKKVQASTSEESGSLQVRIPRGDARGAALARKLEMIAKANSLSINDVANLAVAAGLAMVERKLRELHEIPSEPDQVAA